MNVPSDLYCPVCELSVNSQQQLTQHLGSTKHKLVSLGLLPKPSEDPNIKRVVSDHSIIHYHILINRLRKYSNTRTVKV